MSALMERKLTEIKDAYSNLKTRMASNNIWVYDNTPLNTAFNRFMDFKENLEPKEEVETMSFDGLHIVVKTTFGRIIDYFINDDRTMIIDGIKTSSDEAYTAGLIQILSYTMTNPTYMTDLIDDDELYSIITTDEDALNKLCEYFSANLKYQAILSNFSDAVRTINDYCGKLDDEYVKSVNLPHLNSVKDIMLSSSLVFSGISERMHKISETTDLIYSQPHIFEYIAEAPNAKSLFNDIALTYDEKLYDKILSSDAAKPFALLMSNPHALNFMKSKSSYYEGLMYNHPKASEIAKIMENEATLLVVPLIYAGDGAIQLELQNPVISGNAFICSMGFDITWTYRRLEMYGAFNTDAIFDPQPYKSLHGSIFIPEQWNGNPLPYIQTTDSNNLPLKMFKYFNSINLTYVQTSGGKLYIKYFPCD